jgi:hypothetical protein
MVDIIYLHFYSHARSAFKDWLNPISHREPYSNKNVQIVIL